MVRLILAVAGTELRETFRDRRSLFSGLFYGIWGPLVMGLALAALARDRAEPPLHIAAAGLDGAPALAAYLDAQGVRIDQLAGDVRDVLRARRVSVVLVIEPGYDRDVTASRPAEVTLAFDSAWSASARQGGRLRAMLSEFAQRGHDARLVLRGVSPTAVRPLRVVERDYSTPAGRAATVLGTLPMFLLLSVFIGGMSVAADVMAGERERGSLEALLVHPASRFALALGKWVAVCAVTLATLVVTMVVATAVLTHSRIQSMDLPIGLTSSEAWTIGAALVPLAFAASAVQLLVALRTHSYREAQTQLSYLVFVPMVPGFFLAFGALDVLPWMTLTPILGQHLLVADVLRGEATPDGTSLRLALVTLAVALAALTSCGWLLGRESVLARHGR